MSRCSKKQNKNIKHIIAIIIAIICLGILDNNYEFININLQETNAINIEPNNQISYNIEEIPEYTGDAYVIINNNEPYFKEDEIVTKTFEKYSDLDNLGRCGVAYANVSIDTMPSSERKSIGSIKPSGWQTIKYDIVEGKYLYNRCHLIGYQLTGENANEKNLITCTRYMNTTGMLEFENKVATYIKETKNHVLYRVTPIFEDSNLLASGVEIEGYSVEDNGEGIKFNVYVYNVQEGIIIDYKNGDSKLEK